MRQLVRHLAAFAAGAAAVFGASPAAQAQGLIRDTEIEAVMRDYSDPLIEAAGLDVQSVDFYLIGDDSFNAFVTGGQNIFMHTGAIVIADQPAEIKGVIAHEIGHIAGAHIARSQEAARGGMATMAAALGLGLIAALAGEGGAGAAIIASGPQFATLDFLAYSRSQEAAADQAALSYLEATGQTAQGLIDTFERFRYQEIMSNQRRMEYFRSHPLSSQRIDAMRRRAQESPYFEMRDTPEEVATLRRIQAKIIGFLYPPAQTFTRFPESDHSLPARYARSVAYYKEGRLDRAREEIALLLDMEPDNPFFHELDGQMLYESGRVEESIAPYQRAVEFMPEAELIRIALAASLVAAGGEERLEEAKVHLGIALTKDRDNAYGWYQLAIAHQGLGETALAELATAERSYALGRRIEAHNFATRARSELERGTPAYFRASELIAVTQPSPDEIRRWNAEQRDRARGLAVFDGDPDRPRFN